jgi:hypothetical protein
VALNTINQPNRWWLKFTFGNLNEHKNDPLSRALDKKNYRPVSILTTILKIYEMVLSDRLVEFFNNIFYVLLKRFIAVRPH